MHPSRISASIIFCDLCSPLEVSSSKGLRTSSVGITVYFLHIQTSQFDYEENIPSYLRHYKIDVTLEPDTGFGAIWVIFGISAIVSGNDIVVVFAGTVANFTGPVFSRA